MSIFEKQRFEIFNLGQHPYRHSLAEFAYVNPSMPGVTNVEAALNWMLAVLYPTTKPAVATPAALPTLGNSIGDYRVVTDDGDGKSAGYRWEQREGEVSASWHKIMDVDWSTDSILAAFLNVTQDLYVVQDGKQDLDGAGAVVTGLYAGQTIYGGTQASQNLTLRANSGDGVGASTGYVQVDDNFRAAVHNTWDLGTNAIRFKDGYFQGIVRSGTLSLASGLITDSSGAISFDNENISTTGTVTGATGYFTSMVEVGPLVGNALLLAPGSITDESGAISFGDENLVTTGTLGAGVTTLTEGGQFFELDPNVAGVGRITHSSGSISFDNENLSGSGTLSFLSATLTSFVQGGNLRLAANTLSSEDANGNIILLPNGSGIIDAQKAMTTLGITATGTVSVTGQFNADNLRLDANVISSENVNGNITLTPNGTGVVQTTAHILPSADATKDLGSSAFRFKDLFLSGSIGDGTTTISQATLQSLRDINVGVASGMTIFWNGTKWVASVPDTEIDHGTITGLLDDDHTQYALLAGRAGGQTLIGGTAANNNLLLQSTSNATRGVVQFADDLEPFTNASFAVTWSGTDIGGPSFYFRDIYTKGEMRGMRFENFTFAGLPAFSAQNIGRVMYATDTAKAYIDTGSSIKVLGVSKFSSDTSWNGTDTTKDVVVSADITDARQAMWALHDNANDFDRIYCSLKAISATTVRITVSPPLPAGSYRLLGLE